MRALYLALAALLVAPPVHAGSATLTWTPPTENTDGTPLDDLAGYRLYWGCDASGDYPSSLDVGNAPGAYLLDGLPDVGTCYFVATAYTSAGVESVFSNEASKFMGAPIPPVLPGAPSTAPSVSWSSAQGPPLMSDDLLLFDSFTEASDTPLESHTADSGQSWGSGSDEVANLDIASADGEVAADGSSNYGAQANVSPGTPNYRVEVTGKTGGTSNSDQFWAYIFDGGAHGAQNGYGARLQGSTGNVDLFEITAGFQTLLDSGTIPGFSAAAYYKLAIERNVGAGTVRALVDGDEYASASDSTHTDNDNPGIRFRDSNAKITLIRASTLAGPGAKNVLLVVGDSSNPTTGDGVLHDRITALGHTVTYISDEDTEDYSGQDLIVISESVSSATLGTKYQSAPVPLMVMEPGAFDTYGLCSTDGAVSGDLDAYLQDETEDYFAGAYAEVANPHVLMGTGGGGSLYKTQGTDAPGLINVWAEASDGTGHLLGYVPSGDTLYGGGAAPALRIAYGPGDDDDYEYWTGKGNDVFDRIITAMAAEGGAPAGPNEVAADIPAPIGVPAASVANQVSASGAIDAPIGDPAAAIAAPPSLSADVDAPFGIPTVSIAAAIAAAAVVDPPIGIVAASSAVAIAIAGSIDGPMGSAAGDVATANDVSAAVSAPIGDPLAATAVLVSLFADPDGPLGLPIAAAAATDTRLVSVALQPPIGEAAASCDVQIKLSCAIDPPLGQTAAMASLANALAAAVTGPLAAVEGNAAVLIDIVAAIPAPIGEADTSLQVSVALSGSIDGAFGVLEAGIGAVIQYAAPNSHQLMRGSLLNALIGVQGRILNSSQVMHG